MPKQITVNEAVKSTGYSRQQIYNLVRAEKIKAEKRGWEYWVDVQSLTAYCERKGKTLTDAE